MLYNIAAYVMDNCTTILEKKSFQKILYFLTEAGIPTGLNYTIYHYGPYSSDLDFETGFLELKGAINIKIKKDKYEITKGVRADELKKEITEYGEEIDNILKKLYKKNAKELELLSTMHYIYKVQKEIYNNLDDENIIEEISKMKEARFCRNEIVESYKLLKKYEWI